MNITGFSQVVKLWPHNPVYWLFYEPSLVSNENLESFLKDTYDGDVKRNVSVGASNIDDVSY